jgi:hypothetical protein
MIVLRPSRKTGWSSTLKIRIGFGRSKGGGPQLLGRQTGGFTATRNGNLSHPLKPIRCAADCPPEEKYSPTSVEYSGACFQPKP